MRGALIALLALLPVTAQAASMARHALDQSRDRIAATSYRLSRLGEQPARLKFKPSCILALVLQHRGRTLNAAKPVPPILYESQTPLSRFQDAVEEQWGGRPDVFGNAFSLKTGEIFLIDEAAYYAKLERFIDDSLAHELTHYVQVAYEGADLMRDPFGSYEMDAIHMQNWFRSEIYPAGPTPGCAN